RVEEAGRDLDLASEAVRAAAAALAHVADRIAEEARESEREGLAVELAAEQIARDVLRLDRALVSTPEGTLSAELEALRKLPAAVLDWAQRRLGLVPHLAGGQEMEVPPGRLAAFAFDGSLPPGRGRG